MSQSHTSWGRTNESPQHKCVFVHPVSLLPGEETIKQNELANLIAHRASLVDQIVKNHPARQETRVFGSSFLSTSWRGSFSLQTLFL